MRTTVLADGMFGAYALGYGGPYASVGPPSGYGGGYARDGYARRGYARGSAGGGSVEADLCSGQTAGRKCAILIQESICVDSIVSNSNSTVSLRSFGHSRALPMGVTDHAMEAWYHPSIA
jgi:hypothetical protein